MSTTAPRIVPGQHLASETTDAHGRRLDGFDDIVEAAKNALTDAETSVRNGRDFNSKFAQIKPIWPADRHLGGSESENMSLIAAVNSPAAIRASGGLCAPVTPYYDLMTIAQADRPVRDALPIFDASHGGIRLIPPFQLSSMGGQPRTVTDGTTTNGSNVIGSVQANFSSSFDVGATITGTGIPAATTIISVNQALNQATISANATATGAAVTFTITRQGAVAVITDTTDAAMLNGTLTQQAAGLKPCLHITCPSVTEVHVSAVSACLEFGNLTARAYPQQVTSALSLVMAQHARIAENQLLSTIGAGSMQVTAGAVLGVARDIVPVVTKAAAYLRNHNRMAPETKLRVLLPAWIIDAAVADLVFGSGYEAEFYSMARSMFTDALASAGVNVSYYWDSGTGQGQLLNGGAAQGPGPLFAFPTTAVMYLFSEGSWLFLDGGTLDLGVVRDSILNSQNAYRWFAESFESAAFVGLESLAITATIAVNGGYSPAGTLPTGF